MEHAPVVALVLLLVVLLLVLAWKLEAANERADDAEAAAAHWRSAARYDGGDS